MAINRFVEFVSPNGKRRVLLNAPLALRVVAVHEDATVRDHPSEEVGFVLTCGHAQDSRGRGNAHIWYKGPASAVYLVGQEEPQFVRGDAAEVAERLEIGAT